MRILTILLFMMSFQSSFALSMNGKLKVDGKPQNFQFDTSVGDGAIFGTLGQYNCLVMSMPQIDGAWTAGCQTEKDVIMINIIPMYLVNSSMFEQFAAPRQNCDGSTVLVNLTRGEEVPTANSFSCEHLTIQL